MSDPVRSMDPVSHPQATGNASSSGLLLGSMLPPGLRPRLYERLGRELPPAVWEHIPTGSRVLIAPEPVSEKQGLLWKPRSVTERQKLEMGAGWIIGVGPTAGAEAPHPGGIRTAVCAPVLLGFHVLFKSYSGVSLRIAEDEEEFGGSLLVMTDRDILAVGGLL